MYSNFWLGFFLKEFCLSVFIKKLRVLDYVVIIVKEFV